MVLNSAKPPFLLRANIEDVIYCFCVGITRALKASMSKDWNKDQMPSRP